MATVKIRDPIHNFASFEPDEIAVINSRLVQRLRGIKQLAMASLVYPGALHTRFDHSLGVAHVADSMARALGFSEGSNEIRLLRLAALLHDIGHGPFSHVSEHSLRQHTTKLPTGIESEKIHEHITARLVLQDSELTKIVGQNKLIEAMELLRTGYGEPVLRSIVSGPLDADKQDYLLRDSRFCGVDYGRFDLHQLQRSLTTIENSPNRELAIRHDGVHVVEQFVLAKYYLTSMVYRHKVRLITDRMIVRAIDLGITADQISELGKLYCFVDDEGYLEEYARWDDARFLQRFAVNGDPHHKSKMMLDRLLQRRLLKRVFRAKPTDFRAELRDLQPLFSLCNIDARRKLERDLAGMFSRELCYEVDSDFVIAHHYIIKSARVTSRNNEGSILVAPAASADAASTFEEQSTLFQSIDEKFKEEHLDVYAPVRWDNPTEKSRILSKLRDPVFQLISDAVSTLQPQAPQ